jgi:hypothetical protein
MLVTRRRPLVSGACPRINRVQQLVLIDSHTWVLCGVRNELLEGETGK